jgi:hypothetical protein
MSQPEKIMRRVKLALDELRCGDAGADGMAEWLRYHFLYLVEEAADNYSFRYNRQYAEFLAPFFSGLATAIDRLARNNEETSIENVEKFIRDEIERAKRDYYREISPHILPASSTNSMRISNEQPAYKKIKRMPDPERRKRNSRTGEYCAPFEEQPNSLNSTQEALSSIGNSTPYIEDAKGEFYIPSRMVDNVGSDMELFNELAPSQLEQSVLGMMVLEYSERRIAKELCIKPSRVRAIKEQIKTRATDKGYAPKVRKSAAS